MTLDSDYQNSFKKEYDVFTKFWEINFYTNKCFKTRIAKFYKEEYANLFLKAVLESNIIDLN